MPRRSLTEATFRSATLEFEVPVVNLHVLSAATALCAIACNSPSLTEQQCGNGARDDGEQCDGSAPDELFATCGSLGQPGLGVASCVDCAWQTSQCSTTCGDGVVGADEQCDGNTNGLACTDIGYDDGELACHDCRYDQAGCLGYVTVEVRLNGQPLAGAPVAFADAMGISLASRETDVAGKVTQLIGLDHIVTTARTQNFGRQEVRSLASVDPGDPIVIEFVDTPADGAGNIVPAFPASLPGGALHYAQQCHVGLLNTIPAPGPSEGIFTDRRCLDANQHAQLYTEIRDAAGAPLGYAFTEGIIVPPAGESVSTTVTAWTTEFATTSCEILGAASGQHLLDLGTTFGSVFVDGPQPVFLDATTPGQTLSTAATMPSASFAKVNCFYAGASQACYETRPAPTSFSFDPADIPSPVAGLVIDSAIATRPRFTWTNGPLTGSPDLILIKLDYASALSWWMYGSPEATSLQVPELPTDSRFAPFRLEERVLSIPPFLVKTDRGNVAGYSQLKATGQREDRASWCESIATP